MCIRDSNSSVCHSMTSWGCRLPVNPFWGEGVINQQLAHGTYLARPLCLHDSAFLELLLQSHTIWLSCMRAALSSRYTWYVALLTKAHPYSCSNTCYTIIAWSDCTVHFHMLHSQAWSFAQVLLPFVTQQCLGLSLVAVCLTILALVSSAGGFSSITVRKKRMHRLDQITLLRQPATSSYFVLEWITVCGGSMLEHVSTQPARIEVCHYIVLPRGSNVDVCAL